jgi:hypothetical protein
MKARRPSSPLASVARRLEQIATALEHGEDFQITRLTILKKPCADSATANRFALYLAEHALRSLARRPAPPSLEPDRWQEIDRSAAQGVEGLRAYLADPSSSAARDMLRAAYASLLEAQNEYRDGSWGRVRSIWSREALVVEDAAACMLHPHESAYWGYMMARDFAERYDARHGTGLIPESAPQVREIARFWRQEADSVRASSVAARIT